jgi:Tfp pilus assembly protein PilN
MFAGLLRQTKKRIKVPSLNLYPEDPFYATLVGKILRWAVSAGRHIVIFTELVVIGSFLSRFVLDRQLTDLNTSIVQKQAIAESYGTLEADFRAAQRKTKDIAFVLSTQGRWPVIDTLAKVTPPDVKYSQISLSVDRLSLEGKANSNQSLSLLLRGLQAQPDFSAISVGEIQSGDQRDPGVTFNITLTYQKGLSEQIEFVSGGKR